MLQVKPNCYPYRWNSHNGQTAHRVKKPRILFSPQQSHYLEERFQEGQFPSIAAKEYMANVLELTPQQINIWFQNRRARTRRQRKRCKDDEPRKLTPKPPSFWPQNLPFDSNFIGILNGDKGDKGRKGTTGTPSSPSASELSIGESKPISSSPEKSKLGDGLFQEHVTPPSSTAESTVNTGPFSSPMTATAKHADGSTKSHSPGNVSVSVSVLHLRHSSTEASTCSSLQHTYSTDTTPANIKRPANISPPNASLLAAHLLPSFSSIRGNSYTSSRPVYCSVGYIPPQVTIPPPKTTTMHCGIGYVPPEQSAVMSSFNVPQVPSVLPYCNNGYILPKATTTSHCSIGYVPLQQTATMSYCNTDCAPSIVVATSSYQMPLVTSSLSFSNTGRVPPEPTAPWSVGCVPPKPAVTSRSVGYVPSKPTAAMAHSSIAYTTSDISVGYVPPKRITHNNIDYVPPKATVATDVSVDCVPPKQATHNSVGYMPPNATDISGGYVPPKPRAVIPHSSIGYVPPKPATDISVGYVPPNPMAYNSIDHVLPKPIVTTSRSVGYVPPTATMARNSTEYVPPRPTTTTDHSTSYVPLKPTATADSKTGYVPFKATSLPSINSTAATSSSKTIPSMESISSTALYLMSKSARASAPASAPAGEPINHTSLPLSRPVTYPDTLTASIVTQPSTVNGTLTTFSHGSTAQSSSATKKRSISCSALERVEEVTTVPSIDTQFDLLFDLPAAVDSPAQCHHNLMLPSPIHAEAPIPLVDILGEEWDLLDPILTADYQESCLAPESSEHTPSNINKSSFHRHQTAPLSVPTNNHIPLDGPALVENPITHTPSFTPQWHQVPPLPPQFRPFPPSRTHIISKPSSLSYYNGPFQSNMAQCTSSPFPPQFPNIRPSVPPYALSSH